MSKTLIISQRHRKLKSNNKETHHPKSKDNKNNKRRDEVTITFPNKKKKRIKVIIENNTVYDQQSTHVLTDSTKLSYEELITRYAAKNHGKKV